MIFSICLAHHYILINLNSYLWQSMSSREEQQELVFEEEEVLWAKIRGYPWWPAFVDKIHPNNRTGETEYTVFFFGDNTQYSSSKLGSSKLRKFYDNYSEFYQKARSHKKLMLSIQMAEEKLKQNDQNVQIFEELRVGMKGKKKSGPLEAERKESKISQPEIEVSPSKTPFEIPPELNRPKTYAHRHQKSTLYPKQAEENDQADKDESVQQKESLMSKRNQNQKILAPKQQKLNVVKQNSIKIKGPFFKKGRKSKKSEQEIFQQQPQIEVVVEVINGGKALKNEGQYKEEEILEQGQNVLQVQGKMQQEAEQSVNEQFSDQNEQDLQKSSPEERLSFKKYRSLNHKRQLNQRQLCGPRKRGRPKKRLPKNHSSQQKEVRDNKYQRNNRALLFKKKFITKIKHSPKKRQIIPKVISSDNRMIEELKGVLGNRMELVDYLKNITITTENVKDILDLDVSNILQEGELTHQINEILEVLKTALLFKYFPDDLKHKKRYEKVIKKRNIVKKDEIKQTNEKEVQGNEQESQIRKKTIIKLQKFLKYVAAYEADAKQMAKKIQSYFESKDKTIGDRYKSIAFQVLSSLKEKRESFEQVIEKLTRNSYD